jgi:glycosyltransferase 2 family protein
VEGVPLASMDPAAIDDRLLDAVWREVATLHAAHLAHRSLRTANVLVAGGSPVLIDFGFGDESATPRLLAIDRAELLASLAAQVGVDRALASAARVLDPTDLASSAAYLQPLALSGATRHQASKSTLAELRSEIAATTGQEPPELERLIRVRPRTLVTIAALSGAFYFMLPQLANVDDSFSALRHASLVWLGVCVLLSSLTYVAGAIGVMGGAPDRLPFFSTLEAQLGSSFVNRVTPANAGGMALNVRFMQKAGIEPAGAVTAIGLNVAAGAIVHIVLLVLFVAWAGQGSTSFKIPASSKILVAIAVVLALVGIGLATRWGRRLFQHHVLRHLKAAWASMAVLARSPVKLAALFGGSLGVTLAYIGALAAAVIAVDGGLSFAQVGAVYLGASVVSAAAPTPGGLGAVEAALAAGLTGAGMEGGLAVAAVLSYRLMTYWLPVLPGWIAFHRLQARNVV